MFTVLAMVYLSAGARAMEKEIKLADESTVAAIHFYNEKDYGKTIEIIEGIFAIDDRYRTSDKLNWIYAKTFQDQGKFDDAAFYFEQVIETKPSLLGYSDFMYDYAVNLLNTGEKEKAMLIFEKLTEDPEGLSEPEREFLEEMTAEKDGKTE